MLKLISAALLAASVLVVAPAMAGQGRTQHTSGYTTGHVSADVLNANARMGRHHGRHFHGRHSHHRHHFHRHHHRFHGHR